MLCSRVSFAVVLSERYRACEQAEAVLLLLKRYRARKQAEAVWLYQSTKPEAPLAHARGIVSAAGLLFLN